MKYSYRKIIIKRPIKRNETIKIIVGAAETYQPGWYSTNQQWLDIVNYSDWEMIFKGKKVITHVVAEHVFEHLTFEQSKLALQYIYYHLTANGRIRIAVPDGYYPDPDYLRHVDINGLGDDASDHKQLLNIDTLKELLKETGFRPVHIEGFKKDGSFVQEEYSIENGFILRSRLSELNNINTDIDFPGSNTSLIVDGFKE